MGSACFCKTSYNWRQNILNQKHFRIVSTKAEHIFKQIWVSLLNLKKKYKEYPDDLNPFQFLLYKNYYYYFCSSPHFSTLSSDYEVASRFNFKYKSRNLAYVTNLYLNIAFISHVHRIFFS